MKRALSLLLSLLLLTALVPPARAAHGFRDVPENSWAAESITAATERQLINGMGDGLFGYGASLRRSEFITLLVRLFRWELPEAEEALFTDAPGDSWFAPYLAAAAAHDVMPAGGAFRPNDAITREEMAVFFVRALGFGSLLPMAERFPLPFTDVTSSRGAIAVAYDLGIVNGMSASTFAPRATASREQAAAMLVRVYDRCYHSTDFLHGFYAISSYSQLPLTGAMDAVSAGWSRMTLGADGMPLLRTTSADGNEFFVPQGYQALTGALEEKNIPLHLSVYMDTSAAFTENGQSTGALAALLADPARRTAAVSAIIEEATVPYRTIGHSPYSGVTIDFEGLRGPEVRGQFTAFLTELSAALRQRDMTLYVAVQPALADGPYFDGYDFRSIGELADKVLLMAHDYHPVSLAGFEGTTFHKNAAPAPLGSVYYSLRAAVDPADGVADRSKLVLCLSCAPLAFTVDAGGKLLDPVPRHLTPEAVSTLLGQPGTLRGWSDSLHSPYLTAANADGTHLFVWYEDNRSVEEKVRLAKLFGVDGFSLWRLGLIPDSADPSYRIMDVLG